MSDSNADAAWSRRLASFVIHYRSPWGTANERDDLWSWRRGDGPYAVEEHDYDAPCGCAYCHDSAPLSTPDHSA